MHISPSAVRNAAKIAAVTGPLFNQTARVNVALVGDSTIGFNAHGWEHGAVRGLQSLGLSRFGTALHGIGEGSGLGFGSSNGVNTQNGTNASLRAEWQNYAKNKSTDAGYLGCLDSWFVVADQAGGNFGVQLHGKGGLNLHSRPCEFLAENVRFRMWYMKTDAFDPGKSQITVGSRKDNTNNHFKSLVIENFDPAVGGTFTLTIGGVTTGSITYSTTVSTMQTNIKNAIEAALAGVTVSVSINSIAPQGSISASIEFTAPATTDQGAMTVNTGGLTARYAGSPIVTFVSDQAAGSGFYSTIGSNDLIDAQNAPSVSLGVYERTLAAGSRDYPIAFQTNRSGTTAKGPFVSMFGGAVSDDRATGFAVTPIVYLGGQSARVHATRLQAQTTEFLSSLFLALAQHAGYASPSDSPTLIRIVGGVNDRSDSNNSVGPSPAASNTQAGIYDNWRAIIERIEGVYDSSGWSKSKLCFLITPSAPQVSDDSDLLFARAAAAQLSDARDRVAYVNLNDLHDGFASEVAKLANYTGSVDYPHHTPTGFRVWSEMEWGSLAAAAAAVGSVSKSTSAKVQLLLDI